MKILSIFNTFGGNGRSPEKEGVAQYIRGIQSILDQEGVDQDVVLSSCMGSPQTRNQLMECFGDQINYNFIDDPYPLPVTVNHTTLKMSEQNGIYDQYLYVDSGIEFTESNQIAKMAQIADRTDAAMVSAIPSTDDGFFEGLEWGEYIDDQRNIDQHFKNGIYRIPLGKAIPLHCQFFSKEVAQAFSGKIYNDIYGGHCSESTFSYICASLGRPWVLTNLVKVLHNKGLDGPSGGKVEQWVAAGNSRFDHPYLVSSVLEIIEGGRKYGLGYQLGLVPHDPSKFDENGYATNLELLYYIRDHLFVPKELLDYEKIRYMLI